MPAKGKVVLVRGSGSGGVRQTARPPPRVLYGFEMTVGADSYEIWANPRRAGLGDSMWTARPGTSTSIRTARPRSVTERYRARSSSRRANKGLQDIFLAFCWPAIPLPWGWSPCDGAGTRASHPIYQLPTTSTALSTLSPPTGWRSSHPRGSEVRRIS